jgi:GT2 family glycosyltransferase
MAHYNKSTKNRIAIVITSFKDEKLVLECVDSILAAERSGTEIIVVDCMSRALTKIFKKKYGKKVHLIHLNNDVGVAEQRNIGFRYSMRFSDYTLFLDNDTEIQKNAIKKLSEALTAAPQYSIFQPKIVFLDDKNRTSEIGLNSNIFGIPKPNRNNSITPFFVSGSAMLFKNNLLKEIGGFDSDLEFGAEELDLTWRARLLGYDIKSAPEAVVCHRTQGTRNRLSSARLYMGLRNTIRMLLKNYGSPTNLIFAVLLIVRTCLESVLLIFTSKVTRSFENNVAILATSQNSFPKLIIGFVQAILWNISKMKDTINQHNRIQATRVVEDRKIIRLMRKNDLIFVSPAYHKISRSL